MSTHSSIGLVHSDGSVSLNFCHWDGYPSYNGRLLLEFYPTLDKVKELIALGDLSSLNETVEQCKINLNPPFFECANYPDLNTVLDLAHIDQHIEYMYLFVESIGQWFLVTQNSRDLVFLTPRVCQE
jgi:hypothetical protein